MIAATTNVTSCQSIGLAGVYSINTSLIVNGPTCITLTANNVDLSCYNSSITLKGNLTAGSYAVTTSGSLNNVSVHNCIIASFGNGIGIGSTTNSNVSYNTVANLSDDHPSGISIASTNKAFVGFNTISNITTTPTTDIGEGIYGNQLNNSQITGNIIKNFGLIGVRGILLDDAANSNNNSISSNTVLNLSDVGIEDHGFNDSVSSNTVTNATGGFAAIFHYGNNSLITANVVSNIIPGTSDGIQITSGFANVNVTSNIVTNVGGHGVNAQGNNILVSSNTLVNDTGPAVFDGSSIYVTATNSVVTSNTIANLTSINASAIRVENSANFVNVTSNTISNFEGNGIDARANNTFVASNLVIGLIGSSTKYPSPIGSTWTGVENVTVYNNTIANNTNGQFNPAVSVSGHLMNVSYNTVDTYNGTGISLSSSNNSNASFNTVKNMSGLNPAAFSSNNGGSNDLFFNNTALNSSNPTLNPAFNLDGTKLNVSYNVVSNYNGSGISVGGAANSMIEFNSIMNMSGPNPYGFSSSSTSQNNVFFNNTVSNVTDPTLFPAFQINGNAVNVSYDVCQNYAATCIFFGNVNNSLMLWNIVKNMSSSGNGIDAASGTTKNNTVAFNVLRDSNQMTAAIQMGGSGNNYSYNNVTNINQSLSLGLNGGSNALIVQNNLVNGSGIGIQTNAGANNNSITYNQFINSSTWGLNLVGSSNNTFFGNIWNQNFQGDGAVLSTNNASNNLFQDDQVTSNASDGNNDLVATSNASNTFLNTTLNNSRLLFQDAASNATFQYYLTINVTNNATNLSVSSASINVSNRNSTLLINGGTSNPFGISVQNVTLFLVNSSTTANHTPHNVSVSKSIWSNSTNVTMAGNTNVLVFLSIPFPIVSAVTVSNVTSSSAAISWTTDLSTNSTVQYGTTNSYGLTQTSASNVTSHSVLLTSLASATLHHFSVTSCSSDTCTNTSDATFTTNSNSVFSSSGPSTPVPTLAPTPVPPAASSTPVPGPTVAPEPSAAPSVQPTAAPSPVAVDRNKVVVQLPPGAGLSAGGIAPAVTVSRSLSVVQQTAPSGATVYQSTLVVQIDASDVRLKQLAFTDEYKFIRCKGSRWQDYLPDVVFFPHPSKISCGSAVVTWLFDNVDPSHPAQAQVTIKSNEPIRKPDVEAIGTPKILAKSVAAASVSTSLPGVQAASPTPAGFNWMLPAIGVGLLGLGGAAYFFVRRRSE